MTGTRTLIAFDKDDLTVQSALLQDAVMKAGELTYLPKARRFAAVLNRYVWEDFPDGKGRSRKTGERRRCGLHFELVKRVRMRGFGDLEPDRVLSLLALEHGEGEDGETIDLVFAGGGQIRLYVEAIEATLQDMDIVWAAQGRPEHDLGD